MKKVILLLCMSLLSLNLVGQSDSKVDEHGHRLVKLWGSYYEAKDADLPQQQQEILLKIKDKAKSERLDWDFYDSSLEYIRVSWRRDWTTEEDLSESFTKELEEYDEPILLLLEMRWKNRSDKFLSVIKEEKDRLLKGYHPHMYVEIGHGVLYGDVLSRVWKNDYEYALWQLLTESVYSYDVKDEGLRLLEENVATGTVQDFFLTCFKMNWLPEKEQLEAFKALSARYSGQAVSLVADALVMRHVFDNMPEESTSEDYLKLREQLRHYEKIRKTYKTGLDRIIAESVKGFEYLIDKLEEKDMWLSVQDGKVTMALRNLHYLKLQVKDDDRTIYETRLKNPSSRFYVPDTLTHTLPPMDDGEYTITCLDANGESLGHYSYPKFTLSASFRRDSEGVAVYVTDYRTGEPLDEVDVVVSDSNGKIARRCSLNGFTYIPEPLLEKINENDFNCKVSCRITDRNGYIRKTTSQYTGYLGRSYVAKGEKAVVMTDRGAYRPGDTVRFKAIAYMNGPKPVVVEAGTLLKADLVDFRGKVVRKLTCHTNEFGSIAGEFVLNGPLHNGTYRIDMYKGNENLGNQRFTMDSFLLPTFDLTFEDQEGYALPGQEVSVKGRVISYIGHPLSSIAATVTVKRAFEDVAVYHDDLRILADGSFDVRFVSDSEAGRTHYNVEVAVVLPTGETETFTTSRIVSERFDLKPYLKGCVKGEFKVADRRYDGILTGETVVLNCGAEQYGNDDIDGLELEYEVYKDKKMVLGGEFVSGKDTRIDLKSFSPGLYRIQVHTVMKTSDDHYAGTASDIYLLKVSGEGNLDPAVSNLYYVESDDQIAVCVGTSSSPAWYAVELKDAEGKRVHSEVVYVPEGFKHLKYDFKQEYGKRVDIGLYRFYDGGYHQFQTEWKRPEADDKNLSLVFTRFVDRTMPGQTYSYSVKGWLDSEMLASVYDISTDRIRDNSWFTVDKYEDHDFNYMSRPGKDGNGGGLYLPRSVCIRGYSNDEVVLTHASRVKGYSNDEVVLTYASCKSVAEDSSPVKIREDFSTTLAFEPFLRPDKEGEFHFDVKTSDKLSTFVVALFAHDKSMNTAVLRREFLVTVPVAVSVAHPQFLYQGDRYVLRADVSNISSERIDGRMRLEIFDGKDYKNAAPIGVYETEIAVEVDSNAVAEFPIDVPDGAVLGVKIVFVGDTYQDAQFVTIPVYPSRQILTESHSEVVVGERSREAMIRELGARFVNTSSDGAQYEEISLMKLFEKTLTEACYPESKDAVTQSEALSINLIASYIHGSDTEGTYVRAAAQAFENLRKCVGKDGGISWIRGGGSSTFVTALVLHRLADLRDRGLLDKLVSEPGFAGMLSSLTDGAVSYLDREAFTDKAVHPRCGSLSHSQYMYVRVRYPEVAFDESGLKEKIGKKEYGRILSLMKVTLLEGSTKGDILGKVMRIRIFNGLPQLSRKAESLRQREIKSLEEYAVRHSSGAVYYPNAVLPWRGLIETEAYAHSMICDLFRDLGRNDIADGIRLWLMLQKDNQKWDSRAGFAEAAASVYDATDALKDTRIAVISKTYEIPFEQVRHSGNGFELSVRYFREAVSEADGKIVRKEIKEGEVLAVGEKIYAEYDVMTTENRSFVCLTIPYHACLRPVEQLSGFRWTPYSYREVRNGKIIYWIEVMPEQKISFTEEMYVSQKGCFKSPVPQIESLYAPHYRAVSNAQKPFNTR